MRMKLAFFFLSCSMVLILGHSFLPHDHIDQHLDRSEVKSDIDLSIAEILKFALANNLGANHLEEFKNDKTIQCANFYDSSDCIFLNEILKFHLPAYPCQANVKTSIKVILSFEVLRIENPLRAPPVWS